MRILIVDDDRLIRLLMSKALLQIPGVEVVEAEDGLAAWRILQSELPLALCVSDLTMPRMDGLELLQRIRTHPRWRCMRVIVCSMNNERHRVAQAVSMDIEGYLVKPFGLSKLIETVRKVVQPASDAVSIAAVRRERCNMVFEFYIHKMRDVSEQNEKSLALLRSALAAGDRAGAEHLLAALHQIVQASGLGLLASTASALKDTVHVGSEVSLNFGIEQIASENKRLLASLVKLEEPLIRLDFLMDSPSTSAFHRKFLAAFGF